MYNREYIAYMNNQIKQRERNLISEFIELINGALTYEDPHDAIDYLIGVRKGLKKRLTK